MSENPYAERMRSMPGYGNVDPKVPELLAKVSLDPEEVPISSIKITYGAGRPGHLVITNKRLRWIGTMLARGKHDAWELTTDLHFWREGGIQTGLRLETGDQFQNRGVKGKRLQEFAGLHQTMIEAMRWDAEHAAPEPVEVKLVGGGGDSIAIQITDLGKLRDDRVISDEQFEAGKNKILGL